MLARQDLCRRHERRLTARFDGNQHGEQGHHGLAAAHVALQQPQHAVIRGHVGGDLRHGLPLRAGQGEGQAC